MHQYVCNKKCYSKLILNFSYPNLFIYLFLFFSYILMLTKINQFKSISSILKK